MSNSKIKDWKELKWRYRFNPEVTIDEDNNVITIDGATHDITNKTPKQAAYLLTATVLCKACKVHRIDKGNGSYRYVYAPNTQYKHKLQSLLPNLEQILSLMDTRGMFHAFRSNYNAVTNAKAHIGYNYSAKFDMKNFFDQITRERFDNLSISSDILDYCLLNGVTRQGLPTSPLLASIAFIEVAYQIDDAVRTIASEARMTVYADDITISFNNRMDYEAIKQTVYHLLKESNFKINFKKTKLKFGHKPWMRRIICGVAVDHTQVYRTRKTKMQLRQAIHQQDITRTLGLIEWASCKEPRARR